MARDPWDDLIDGRPAATPPRSAPPRPPPRAAPPAPRDPWTSLASTFSPTYNAPPKGQETLADLPSAVAHRFFPTAAEDIRNVGRAIVHPDPRLTYGLYDAFGGSTLDPALRALNITPPRKPAPGTPSIGADIVRNLNQRYVGIDPRHPYGNPQNVVSTAVQDPGGTAMDLGTIAAGGEALTGESAIGRALGAAKYVDPLQLSGSLAARGARAARTAVRGGAVLDQNGAFTPKARAMISQAAPGLTDADLARPGVRTAVASAMQNKGVNPAAVREGLITYHGVPAPRGPVTGAAPPRSAQAVTDKMIANGKAAIGQKLQAMAGPPVSDTVLGDTLNEAHTQAKTAVDNAYKTARTSSPGTVDPATFQSTLGQNIKAALEDPKNQIESNPKLLEAARPGLANAITRLTDATKVFGDAGKLTFPNLNDLRRGIGNLDTSLTPHETGVLKGAFDKSVTDMAGATPVTPASGVSLSDIDPDLNAWAERWGLGDKAQPAGAAVSPDTTPDSFINYRNANKANQSYHNNFGNDANPTVRRAVKKSGIQAVDSAPGDVDLGGSAETAHAELAKDLVKPGTLKTPATASKLYEDLANGPFADPASKQALDDHIRQTALATDPQTGAMVAKPSAVRAFLDTPLGQQVFSPTEASDLRLAASATDALDNPMAGGSPGLGPVARATGAGLFSAAMAPLIPALHAVPWIVREPVLGAAGVGAEAAGEALTGHFARGAARAGAPTAGGLINPVAAGVEAAGTAAPALSRAHAVGLQALTPAPAPTSAAPVVDNSATPDAEPVEPPKDATAAHDHDDWDKLIDATPQAAGGRIGFAVGGEVGDMTEKLMQRAERAQRASQAATKPLLGLSDDTVARALQVAQRGF